MSEISTPRSELVTPKKHRLSTETPRAVHSGTPAKIKESAGELQNFIHEWSKLHMSGSVVLNSIKSVKLDALRSSDFESAYPQGLQERCDQLQNVVDKMELCLANLSILVHQFSALMKLNALQQGGNDEVVYLSWSTEKFRQSLQTIYDAYSKELKLKNVIKEEVAHSTSKERLVYYITNWMLQPNIGHSCQLLCESLFCETGLR
ncbi:hypothetical protein ONE63_002049 [Megalurothrips usitatus]|uniref:Cyclin-dependent kinase 2-interacting protein n=1 Tax=Megalurothrips usitatus TaxID=439358 RepID=A0AAV7XE26_9NEOP|nr:hypothetical protein ONE63_002049 [Megalurothrips usitatus]